MPLIWIAFAAICLFMFIFTAVNLSGNTASFIAIGWFIAFVIIIFEAGSVYLVSRHKPTRAERNAAYWESMKGRH